MVVPVYMVIYLLGFQYLESKVTYGYHIIHCELDSLIPFCRTEQPDRTQQRNPMRKIPLKNFIVLFIILSSLPTRKPIENCKQNTNR